MGIIWELDFYSRPILDDNQKKLWEVLIFEAPLGIEQPVDSLFQYSQFCSNKMVNSLWLREAIEKAIAESGKTPQKIRFFRRQMNNMIVKAGEELGIPTVPSRRTYALNQWLAQRMEDFYPHQPGYDPAAALPTSVQYPEVTAVALPDALRGDRSDKWAFVSLAASEFAEMDEWDIAFGEAFPLSIAGVTPQMRIPGLIVFSLRALALAGWLSGLEMAYLKVDDTTSRPFVRLETGASESWVLANITDAKTLAEARRFEAAKEKSQTVHFLAIQSSPESESFAGLWLLKT